jgi:threonine 3-dehydrogenase
MKALVKTNLAFGATLMDIPVPDLSPYGIRVRVQLAGICGSDVVVYRWDGTSEASPPFKIPLIMGHEMCGTVVEVGTHVQGLEPGMRVVCETHSPCGVCRPCRIGSSHICRNLKLIGRHLDGCLCEIATLPEACAVPVPGDLSADEAVLLEPLGVAVHSVQQGLVSAKTVLVVGCGSIGLLAVAVAEAFGAGRLIAADLMSERVKIAEKLGAHNGLIVGSDFSENLEEIKKLTDGEGVDVALETSGSLEGFRLAIESLGRGGRLVSVGVPSGTFPLDVANHLVRKETSVVGIYGRKMYATWDQAFTLVRGGKVPLKELVTHRFSLDQIARGFELQGSPGAIKVLIEPPEGGRG